MRARRLVGSLWIASCWILFACAPVAAADSAGPYSIGGTVLDYDGSPVAGALVTWGWADSSAPFWFAPEQAYHSGGTVRTDADGAFSIPGVTSSPGYDVLHVWNPERWSLSIRSGDFSTQPGHVIQPARVPISVTNVPDGAWINIHVGDAATGWAESALALVDDRGFVMALPPGFATAMCQWGHTVALEWTSPDGALVPVGPGETAEQEIVLDWSQARRGRLAGTSWQHSARPGDVVTFVLRNWPAGYEASFYGVSETDDATPHWFDKVYTSPGAEQVGRVSLRLPNSLRMDYLYIIGAYRSDDPKALLYLQDYLQPCKFRATQTSISRGEAVQFRGLILGDDRRVDLFERHSAAGRPKDKAATGWTKVATLTAARDGSFRTGDRRPGRTTWYVARVRGYEATVWTPVVKVAVR